MQTPASPLLTAEEFGRLPDDGRLAELVRGKVVPLAFPTPRHGEICATVAFLLGSFVKCSRLGRMLCNKAGFITQRNPDTVRGPDLSYYSYCRVAPGPMPWRYLDVAPDLALEVRCPADPWRRIQPRIGEYLTAAVTWVCVLDQQTHTIHLFHADQAPRILNAGDEFHLPDVLGDFRSPVRDFFA